MKTITRQFAVIDVPFTGYMNHTYKVGSRFRLGNRWGNHVTDGNLFIYAGMSVHDVVPKGSFHVEIETEVQAISVTTVRN